MTVNKVRSELLEQGWSVYSLVDSQPVHEIRESILSLVRQTTGNSSITLEKYHEFMTQDSEHYELQKVVADYARSNEFSKKILVGQLDFIHQILGPDISMTTTTLWRIARPNKPQDNIGFHRDFEIGLSPFQMSLWFPLVDVDEKSCMKMLPGSHRMSRDELPYEKTTNPDVERGSDMNKLGFMWAPHVYQPWFEDKMQPVPVKVGEGLIFHTPMMHGQRINTGDTTRWSTDFGIVNSFAFAPVLWFHHGDESKYQVVSESPAIQVGQLHQEFPNTQYNP